MSQDSRPVCTCPEYTQGLRICAGVCAVLQRQGRGLDYKKETMLHPMWLLKNHPLFELVKSDVPLSVLSAHAVQATAHREPLAVSSVAPTDILRHACLSNLFEDVLPQSMKSPFFEQLRDNLLRHKQVIAGQLPCHPPLFAPISQLSVAQQNAGQGSQADAVNLSRLPTIANRYNRGAGNRVAAAQAKDPSAYSVHTTAVHGTKVMCCCGAEITNSKGARAYHRAHHKGHLQWLASWRAGTASVQAAPACSAPANAASPDTALDGDLWECGSSEASDTSASNRNAVYVWDTQGDSLSEDVKLIHDLPQDDSYYLRFGNLTRRQYGVQLMQRCWVQVNGSPIAGIVRQIFFLKVKKRYLPQTMHIILWYEVVNEQRNSIGYFSSSRVTTRETGWSLGQEEDDAREAPQPAAAATVASSESAFV